MQAVHPHISQREDLVSFLCCIVLSGEGKLSYSGRGHHTVGVPREVGRGRTLRQEKEKGKTQKPAGWLEILKKEERRNYEELVFNVFIPGLSGLLG